MISGMNNIYKLGGSPDMYVVLCGAMTPAQKAIVRQKKIIDSKLYKTLIINRFEGMFTGLETWKLERIRVEF